MVRSPEGESAIDFTGKKSGRGAYVCRDEGCLDRSVKQRQLERALGSSVGEEIIALLRRQIKYGPRLVKQDE